MKAILTSSALARLFLMAAVVPLSAILPRAHSAEIQQTQVTNEEIYREVLKITKQARPILRSDRYREASALIQNALKLIPKDDVITAAAIHNVVGNLLAGETYYQLAISQYEQAMMMLSGSQGQDFDAVKKALQELGFSAKAFYGSDVSLSADLDFIEIKEIGTLQKRHTGLQELSATLLINNGNVYVRQHQYRQADGLYQNAIQAAKDPSLNWLRRRASSNLAWCAIKQGRTDEAGKILDTLLKDVPPSTPPVELRRTLLAVAVQLGAAKKYSDAIERLEQVLPLYKAAPDSRGLVRATAHLADAHLAAGNPATAKALLTKVVSDSNQDLDPEIKRYVHATFAQANWRLGELETALYHFQIYLEQIERIGSDLLTEEGALSFRETQNEILENYVRTALALAEKQKTYEIARKAIERIRARSFLDLAEAGASLDEPSPGQMPAASLNWLAHYKNSEWERMPATTSYRRSRLDMFAEIANAAPIHRVGRCGRPRNNLKEAEEKPITRSDTSNSLRVTVLEYYVLKEQTIALVKNGDGKVSGVSLPVGDAKLTELIDAYIETLDVSNRRGVKIVGTVKSAAPATVGIGSEQQIAKKLYDLLIGPVRALLPSRPDEQLLIIPHRALWYLPFASLARRTGTRMIDEFLLVYAASEETWKLAVNRSRKYNHQTARAWIVGNPTVGGEVTVCGRRVEFADLPGARREAEDIALLFGKDRGELFIGAQADRLRLEAWYPAFGVIHLAAHGVACPTEPFDSAILLAGVDGASVKVDDNRKTAAEESETSVIKLTVRSDQRFPVKLCEVPALEWTKPDSFAGELPAGAVITRYRLNADLVTLSACQTGLGATLGEGMIGFTRAFQAAGARTLVVSLWSVSDDATRDLMVEFYTEYLKHGNKAVALRKAMMATRQKYPHPRMWAAFSLFGAAE